MSLFKRMREMAQASADGHFSLPSQNDQEGQIALQNLREIWKETRQRLNRARAEGEPEISAHDIKGAACLDRVLEGIARDEALAFNGWDLGHDGVSFVKVFDTHAQLMRARELLARVDFADGEITHHIPPAAGDRELRELPRDNDLKRKARHREHNATRLAVRRDWMEAFADGEDKIGCLPTR